MTSQEALAQAVKAVWVSGRIEIPPDELTDTIAAAILATEPMQAIARQAAVGEAVQRLQRYRSSFMLDWHPNAWLVTVRATPESKGVAATLPEAIAAALEDDR